MGELSFLLNVTVALFVIVDPFAVVPVYLNLSRRFTPEEQKAIRRKATIIATTILVGVALTGLGLFKFFGITLPAFQIAGGILLLRLGIEQLSTGGRERVSDEEQSEGLSRDDVSIFPLATPLLAGPGSISTVVLYSSQATDIIKKIMVVSAVFLVMGSSYLLLWTSPAIYRLLGTTGLNLLTRLMAIILCAIAVQFIINGTESVLSQFPWAKAT